MLLMQGMQAASLDTKKSPVYVSFIVLCVQHFYLATSLACLTRSREKWLLHHCVACCALGVSITIFSVNTKTLETYMNEESQDNFNTEATMNNILFLIHLHQTRPIQT